jgi:hypothetical protein
MLFRVTVQGTPSECWCLRHHKANAMDNSRTL